jgi:hypothetical protein
MPEFTVGQTIETKEPTIEVTVTPQRPLPPGKLVFQLQVVDDSGNVSAPTTVDVIVKDKELPTAVLTAPTEVPAGQSFTLNGQRSSDAGGGQVVRYRWTLIQRG